MDSSLEQAEFAQQAEALNAFVKKFTGKDMLGDALKNAGGAPAVNLPPGVADIKPTASATNYGDAADAQNATVEDIARKAFGLTPRQISEAQANPADHLFRSAGIRTAESIPVSVPKADAQTAMAENLAREAFGVEPIPTSKIQTTSPIRLVFKLVGPLILTAGDGGMGPF
jgi:hypothetical protein